jgi:hypothetical protein
MSMGAKEVGTGQVNINALKFGENHRRLFFSDLYLLFVRPRRLFQELQYQPRILAPWLFISAVVLLSYFVLSGLEINFELEYSFGGNLSGDTDAAVKLLEPILFLSKLALIVNALIISIFGFLLVHKKSSISFKQILSVMLYGESVLYTGVLIAIPVTLVSGHMYPLSLVPLALRFGWEPSGIMFFLASKADPFFIYEIICIGIGFSVLQDCDFKTGLKMSLLSAGLFSMAILSIKIIQLLAG